MDEGGDGLGKPGYQEAFHARWARLRDPHVRALAWLLEAPDLMAIDAPCWHGRIATLGPVSAAVAAWLNRLQDDAALNRTLHAHMAHQPSARLGRYAEKLLAFYLRQQDQLVAANLQVRNGDGARETVGEFDFLVRRPDVNAGGILEHWEFATKFYLLEKMAADGDAGLTADAFVGPNLADSLGRKMRKIMDRQLVLSRHPAAAAVLPQPVGSAQALVKGWLFYRDDARGLSTVTGIAADHCHGFWCEADELPSRVARHGLPGEVLFLPLPRLEWLAPARANIGRALRLPDLQALLRERFVLEAAPVMVAVCRVAEEMEEGDKVEVLEVERGFVVPDGWRQRAAESVRHAVMRI